MRPTFTLHDAQEIFSSAYRFYRFIVHLFQHFTTRQMNPILLSVRITQTLIYQISTHIFLGAMKLHQK